MSSQFMGVVAEVLEVPADELTDDAGPRVLGQWTSLKHLRLIAALEDAFGVRFTPREIRSANTVGALRDIVDSKVSSSA